MGEIKKVGPRAIRVRIADDGSVLMGMRKFTPAELIQYKYNMYGRSYFKRLGKTNAKKLTQEQRHQRVVDGWKTKDDLYDRHELAMRTVSGRRNSPKFDQWRHNVSRAVNRPDVIAKRNATIRSKQYYITDKHTWAHRYFICDCDIDGQEFLEGQWINMDDPLYERAREMMLVEPKDRLTPETRHLAMIWNGRLNGVKMRCKGWLSRRPDVVYAIISGANSKFNNKGKDRQVAS